MSFGVLSSPSHHHQQHPTSSSYSHSVRTHEKKKRDWEHFIFQVKLAPTSFPLYFYFTFLNTLKESRSNQFSSSRGFLFQIPPISSFSSSREGRRGHVRMEIKSFSLIARLRHETWSLLEYIESQMSPGTQVSNIFLFTTHPSQQYSCV